MKREKLSFSVKAAVAVAALGYFVDVFDILLFSVVRTASLKDLGVPAERLMDSGVFLINAQMAGMLLGGILWGIWGDKRGRMSVLFGSILLYSLANIANGFAVTVNQYAVLRFLAGLGLAGELGAGVTLVAEILPTAWRGIGTTIIATVGVAGGLTASLVGGAWPWRTAYFIAGGMGLLLLCLRVSVSESGLFRAMAHDPSVARGDLRLVLHSPQRVLRYLRCLFIGVPIYFVLGIYVTFAPEFGAARGLGTAFTAADAVFYSYIGFILGDLASGLLSQWLRSRRQALVAFISLSFVACCLFLFAPGLTLGGAKALYVLMGFSAGHWAVMITVSAEQFGTNLRSTVATTIPNFVRGMVIPMTTALQWLKPELGVVSASFWILAVVSVLALGAAFQLKESFSTDLDYLEK